MTVTKVVNAEWILAFDGAQHRLLSGGVVVYRGDTILFVGPEHGYHGPADDVINADNCLVIPGLINTLGRAGTGIALRKSLYEDIDDGRKLYFSTDYGPELTPANVQDRATAVQASMLDLVKSGCTTVVDCGPYDDMIATAVGDTGIRAYLGQTYASGRAGTANGHRVEYELGESHGQARLEAATAFAEQVNRGVFGNRLQAVLAPDAADTCLPHLLRATHEAAGRLGMPVRIQVARSVPEVSEIIRRHGVTPVGLLDKNGLLGPRVLLANSVFFNDHPLVQWKAADDIALLQAAGSPVAYSPWGLALQGHVMHAFTRLIEAGANLCIGADTPPQDMLLSMRYAAIFAKYAERNAHQGTTSQVFNASTLGPAEWLGRPDLGRLAAGAKADLVLVDMHNLWMQPARDPMKSLVYSATSRTIKTVIIAGQPILRDGQVLTIDEARLITSLPGAQQRAANATFPRHDWAARSATQFSPLSFPLWDQARQNPQRPCLGAACQNKT